MARFVLEWRQAAAAEGGPAFVTRGDYRDDVRGVKVLAVAARARAWREEFRLSCRGLTVYTSLYHIEEWRPDATAMPAEARTHLWRHDLGRDLAADLFLKAVRESIGPAVMADILLARDGEALVRFAHASVRRPAL